MSEALDCYPDEFEEYVCKGCAYKGLRCKVLAEIYFDADSEHAYKENGVWKCKKYHKRKKWVKKEKEQLRIEL